MNRQSTAAFGVALAALMILGHQGLALADVSADTTLGAAAMASHLAGGGVLRLQDDPEFEAPAIAEETFAQTLENTASHKNYWRILTSREDGETQPEHAYLWKVVVSRRYAKLVEDLGGPDAKPCAERLVLQLTEDAAKFARMRAGWKPEYEWECFGNVGATYDPNLEDQSDLASALASRLYACQMLVGHFQIAQALPQVLEAVDAMEGSLLINWGAAMYACDKVLSAEPNAVAVPTQLGVREEYLAWKRSLVEKNPERGRFFDYQTEELFSVVNEGGPGVTVECPPLISQGMSRAALRPEGPQQEVVAFARRFVDAGTRWYEDLGYPLSLEALVDENDE